MVVVGTPIARTAGSAHAVREDQLSRAEYDDPHAALGSVPGVYFRGEEGLGLRPNIGLRGVNPDRSKKVTLVEDGVLFGPAPYSAPAAYYFPLITRMTQLRVIKGPAAIGHGPQTVGGAIDVVTRGIPNQTSAAFDLAGGMFGYRKAHGWVGSNEGPIGFLIEGAHLATDGFKQLPDGGDTGFYRNEWMVKAAYAPNDRNELRLKATYSEELSNETYLGLTDADFEQNPLQRYGVSKLDRMRNHRTSFVLTHILDIDDDLELVTDAYRHDFYRVWRKVNRFRGADLFDALTYPEDPVNEIFVAILRGEMDSASPQQAIMIGPNERDFASQGIQSRLRWDTHTGPFTHALELGVRLHDDLIDRRHSEDAFEVIAGEPDLDERFGTTITALNSAHSTALALHAIDAITWEALTLTPGVRVELIASTFDDRLPDGESNSRWAHAVLPGVGAFYALTRDFGLLAGVYRGFSPPAPGSDDDVEPELSVNFEAGARYSRKGYRAEVIGFYNDYSNLTDVCTLSSGCTDTNLDRQFDAGAARIYGLEAFAGLEPNVGPLTLPVTLAYTATHSEFRTTFQSEDPIFGDVQKGDEMPYVPRHQLSAIAGVQHAVAGGEIGVTYVAPMREQAGSGPIDESLHTDAYLVLDVDAQLRLIEHVELYVNVRNLLDRHSIVARRPFGARPNIPRWIQVGTKLTF